MPDREKAIRGLIVCSGDGECCDRCPYQGEEYCTDAVMRDALELLREQEPVKPFHECTDGLYPRTLISNKYFVFCPYCGRKVKWDADGA